MKLKAFRQSKPWALPKPSNYPLLDSKYHQIRTIRFQLRVVGRSRLFWAPKSGILTYPLDYTISQPRADTQTRGPYCESILGLNMELRDVVGSQIRNIHVHGYNYIYIHIHTYTYHIQYVYTHVFIYVFMCALTNKGPSTEGQDLIGAQIRGPYFQLPGLRAGSSGSTGPQSSSPTRPAPPSPGRWPASRFPNAPGAPCVI